MHTLLTSNTLDAIRRVFPDADVEVAVEPEDSAATLRIVVIRNGKSVGVAHMIPLRGLASQLDVRNHMVRQSLRDLTEHLFTGNI